MPTDKPTESAVYRRSLSVCVADSLKDYFDDLGGEPCGNLHDMTLGVVEKALMEYVLRRHGGNLSATAKTLGISRTTLNRKLSTYGARS